MKITVIGTGYVGLVQGAVLADVGNDVLCVDIDETKIEKLKAGHCSIHEAGLAPLLTSGIKTGKLNFTTDQKQGAQFGEIIFLAVGTPPDEDGSADLQHILNAAEKIGAHITKPKIIVNKSTVPVGTAEKVTNVIQKQLKKRGIEIDFEVVSNPEFLKEGAAVADCKRPDRIIIGTQSEKAAAKLRQLYAPFNRNHDKIIQMDAKSAELTKYAANAMLATKISFMNEISQIAEKLGADIENIRLGIGSDARIGYHFIYAGAGYGGSCFPKDVKALIHTAKTNNFEPKVMQAVENRNGEQRKVLGEKIINHYKSAIKNKTIAIWGLSFKPETDDMREAPSIELIKQLIKAGAKIKAYDPAAMQEAQKIINNQSITYCDTPQDAIKSADALAIVTEWRHFKSPDFEELKNNLKDKIIFDGRNLYSPQIMADAGLHYHAIGRPYIKPNTQINNIEE